MTEGNWAWGGERGSAYTDVASGCCAPKTCRLLSTSVTAINNKNPCLRRRSQNAVALMETPDVRLLSEVLLLLRSYCPRSAFFLFSKEKLFA